MLGTIQVSGTKSFLLLIFDEMILVFNSIWRYTVFDFKNISSSSICLWGIFLFFLVNVLLFAFPIEMLSCSFHGEASVPNVGQGRFLLVMTSLSLCFMLSAQNIMINEFGIFDSSFAVH